MRRRTRNVNFDPGYRVCAKDPYGTFQYLCPTNAFREREVCIDELHRGPPFTSGGPLDLWKYTTDEWDVKSPAGAVNGTGWYTNYWCTIYGHLPNPALRPTLLLPYSSFEDFMNRDPGNDTSSYGATGWNKARPTNSGANLGQFLGEIQDVPRMLQGTAKGFADLWRGMGGHFSGFGPKSVADHWLNTQFGWLPFLSDIRSFISTTENIQAKLNQLRKDNGHWIRRRRTVSETESVDASGDTGVPPLPGVSTIYRPSTPPYGNVHWELKSTRRIWFEGVFKYWIPGNPNSVPWTLKALAQTYGLQPSPSLVWELTPWSWLIDWTSNVGDVIANMSSVYFDNLCAKYAFVMSTYKKEALVQGTSLYRTTSASPSWSASYVSKHRVGASPFGFGLTGIDFDPRQWSILTALGLSRAKYS